MSQHVHLMLVCFSAEHQNLSLSVALLYVRKLSRFVAYITGFNAAVHRLSVT